MTNTLFKKSICGLKIKKSPDKAKMWNVAKELETVNKVSLDSNQKVLWKVNVVV